MRQIAAATQVQIVAPEPKMEIRGATVTPDGNFVDFVRGPATVVSVELWRVPFLGGVPKRLIDSIASRIGWSPDGQHMAFLRSPNVNSVAPVNPALIVADSDGSHERAAALRDTR